MGDIHTVNSFNDRYSNEQGKELDFTSFLFNTPSCTYKSVVKAVTVAHSTVFQKKPLPLSKSDHCLHLSSWLRILLRERKSEVYTMLERVISHVIIPTKTKRKRKDKKAWHAAVHGVIISQTWLSDSMTTILEKMLFSSASDEILDSF